MSSTYIPRSLGSVVQRAAYPLSPPYPGSFEYQSKEPLFFNWIEQNFECGSSGHPGCILRFALARTLAGTRRPEVGWFAYACLLVIWYKYRGYRTRADFSIARLP